MTTVIASIVQAHSVKMLVEGVVADDVAVATATSKLHAMALSSRPSSIACKLSSLRLPHSSSTTSLTSINSALSSPSCSSTPVSVHDNEALRIVSVLIHDLIDQVCHRTYNSKTSSSPEVNTSSEFSESGCSDEEAELVRNMIAEMTEQFTFSAHSPLPDYNLHFQASSLLDPFYGIESKASQDDSLLEKDIKAVESCWQKDRKSRKDDKLSDCDSECEIIEIDVGLASQSIPDLDGSLADWQLNWIGFPNYFPYKCDPEPIGQGDLHQDEPIHFYKPNDSTPADLLPLYEPEVPLEFPYPRLQSSLASKFSITNIDYFEEKHRQDSTPECHVVELMPVDENAFTDLNLVTEDFVITLSDEEYQSQGSVIRPVCRIDECKRFSVSDHHSSLSRSSVSFRKPLCRKRSTRGDDDQSLNKRSRTIGVYNSNHDEHHYCNDYANLLCSQAFDVVCQTPSPNASNQEPSSFAKNFRKCSERASTMLFTFWQFCVYFIGVLASFPNAFASLCARLLQILKLIMVELVDKVALCICSCKNISNSQRKASMLQENQSDIRITKNTPVAQPHGQDPVITIDHNA